MRYGIAIDLHAPAARAEEVAWANVGEQALTAERLGLDLVVVPDHLAYRPGDGSDGYSVPGEPVGVRESMTVAAAIAAITSTIGIGHSVVNAPYRTPAMVAHLATTLADISGGRYSLGIGVGNTDDYDQLGVAADHRVDRFEECLVALSGLLHDGYADLDGRHWRAAEAELAFRGDAPPPIIVAAGGPRTIGLAARYGDGWNGWCPTDPEDATVPDLLARLADACAALDRDADALIRTGDLAVDPLNARGARQRSTETLERLGGLGLDEVRCYPVCEPDHGARLEAIAALAELVASD
jgi:alkanesulfonate monooxygenase SsuD/methylene tetrahydromethanopterin reductase-like flavin-dependent oxidoreductase (luciferase family)